MSSAGTTSTRMAARRLVLDTDVVSYIFKWHPTFAPLYVALLGNAELVLSFMTVAEMRQGALDAGWGNRKRERLEAYLAEFSWLQSEDGLCSIWAAVRNESGRKGHPISSADAWIAATAILLDVPLVTNNPRDYLHLGSVQIICQTL